MSGSIREVIFDEIVAERARQDARWGSQRHLQMGTGPDLKLFGRRASLYARVMQNFNDQAPKDEAPWASILLEEVFEALAEEDPQKLRHELIQVLAVATAMVESIDGEGLR